MFTPLRLAILATSAIALPALAAGPLQVESKVLAEQKTRAPDGTVRVALAPVRRVVPGDRVTFVLAYRNTGTQPLGNVVLDNPVPKGIAYRAPAPTSAAPEVSVDGKTYGALASLRVASGTGTTRAATADDVTHVRWRLARPITAGAQGQLAFEAVLR
ncbi:DUF11 domain-containing protein [Sphingomonas sp. PAMC 26617]|uniref:DUF11 domain-containing protein n=1 Tax=Sphingomonas sp. PAMC 26617 TaxID=1112216 RepID=UPI0002886AD3|nr:DUF11 domain-containing protein [Sphingomonas sp. PAMC 26617]